MRIKNFIFNTALLNIIILCGISLNSCKKSYVFACEIGYKKQNFEEIYLPIPIPNNEKYIIQTQSEYESIFQQFNHSAQFIYVPNYTLPSIDFNNKTLIGAYIDYSSKMHFSTDLFLCYNKKRKKYTFEVYCKEQRRQNKKAYYPQMHWILIDKISDKDKIDIEIRKK